MAYAEGFTALADPTRRHILEALRQRPKTAGELAEGQPVSRPAVSQHLKVLQSARLVSVQPQGNRRLYSIKRDGLDDLRTYLESFWSDVLSSYGAEIVRRMTPKRRTKWTAGGRSANSRYRRWVAPLPRRFASMRSRAARSWR